MRVHSRALQLNALSERGQKIRVHPAHDTTGTEPRRRMLRRRSVLPALATRLGLQCNSFGRGMEKKRPK